jgi:uncharacterized protein DUF1156
LAAARAVLFAQLVNDPGGKRGYGAYKGQTREDAHDEREELFQIIRDLVKWENTNNEEVLEKAHVKIRESSRDAVCNAFAALYTKDDKFSSNTRESSYADRLKKPIQFIRNFSTASMKTGQLWRISREPVVC